MLCIKGVRRIEKMRFFPYKSKFLRKFKYFAFIGLGSNMNDEKKCFRALFRLFMDDRRLRILATSPLLINKAFGYEFQKDFTNAVMLLQTSLHARAFLKILLFYEFKFKRQRIFKNAPRTLDLDLLYFSKKVREDSFCKVPHECADKRISVILPLGFIEGR
ncbi:2-amino-4-hydroxy-6-hydroxymethyldihydropteridine diphosphokinase [Campylobacter sp. LR264d]|uniref:2-amino-4-hydroxy-6- hydroxymethyldihydropteridine diphosphokinase n=1 Tax=unclassified Campylobacter TaxID=2593542 RepID=UPI0012382F94|nr:MULTISPECIES: 2-amino-4-hydroxy-6-hydroxymethyldihydropteridine diphosphokinase [unclassified Campylobacter]KAA6227955.1 2-amino-4-hydroxy-6-hydroxymethyldihydropteridine diphosphokinase [Campylobacter sp. LR185c]KAA6228365.1 2-amino-4-hydroxy-6-hydroxymethyldihydropteridine diphosphokinase [Campylobacter sp. LR196d]KAA6231172.1 2-amino-4-hydroxy-6-hydroxymethyldihydropteridine diphosphokinase [Campylobacter sp. LR264d]KAA8604357.1 2-amino-4-hydroxy-6-hydroxymethyldihydropteridine diphosphok